MSLLKRGCTGFFGVLYPELVMVSSKHRVCWGAIPIYDPPCKLNFKLHQWSDYGWLVACQVYLFTDPSMIFEMICSGHWRVPSQTTWWVIRNMPFFWRGGGGGFVFKQVSIWNLNLLLNLKCASSYWQDPLSLKKKRCIAKTHQVVWLGTPQCPDQILSKIILAL